IAIVRDSVYLILFLAVEPSQPIIPRVIFLDDFAARPVYKMALNAAVGAERGQQVAAAVVMQDRHARWVARRRHDRSIARRGQPRDSLAGAAHVNLLAYLRLSSLSVRFELLPKVK